MSDLEFEMSGGVTMFDEHITFTAIMESESDLLGFVNEDGFITSIGDGIDTSSLGYGIINRKDGI